MAKNPIDDIITELKKLKDSAHRNGEFMSIAVMTDTASGMSIEECRKNEIEITSIPVIIDDKVYREDVDISKKEFFERQAAGARIMTSAPALGDVIDVWNRLLKAHDEIVYIPLSSALSSSCQMASMAANDYDGRVHVVNNQRISVTQRQSVYEAKCLARSGKSGKEIKDILEETRFKSHIYIMVNTLKYLKAGGRITPAAAAIASVLNLKPILQIQGDKLDAYAKSRGVKGAKKTMLNVERDNIEAEFGGLNAEKKCWIGIAYTQDIDAANQWKAEVEEAFPGFNIHMDELSMAIAVHIGPGALAITNTGLLEGGMTYEDLAGTV